MTRVWYPLASVTSSSTPSPLHRRSAMDDEQELRAAAAASSSQRNVSTSPLSMTDTDEDDVEEDHPAPKMITITVKTEIENEMETDQGDPVVVAVNPRRRINSRDIPRTYAGLFGGSDDLLPFECNRHPGTLTSQFVWFLLGTYVTLVFAVHIVVCLVWIAVVEGHESEEIRHIHTTTTTTTSATVPALSQAWTITNAIHLGVTLIYIHWLKGNLYDEQGEMNAMTLWEQLDATVDTRPVRRLLLVVPTLLTYAACHFADYRKSYCLVNVLLWLVAMLPKLGFMNGVRIFGINRTVGIDDVEEDDEDKVDNNNKNKKSSHVAATTKEKLS